jgi:hypothetical protein
MNWYGNQTLIDHLDVVDAEEQRMKNREQAIKEHEERDRDLGKNMKAKVAKE